MKYALPLVILAAALGFSYSLLTTKQKAVDVLLSPDTEWKSYSSYKIFKESLSGDFDITVSTRENNVSGKNGTEKAEPKTEDAPKTASQATGPFRILMNYLDEKNYLALDFSAEKTVLSSIESGLSRTVAEGRSIYPLASSSEVRIKWRKPILTVLGTGQAVLRVPVESLTSGKAGFGVSKSSPDLKTPAVQKVSFFSFTDDFMRGVEDTSDWQPQGAGWEVRSLDNPSRSSNAFVYMCKSEPGSMSLVGKDYWDNYRAEVSMFVPAEGKAGVVFNARDRNNYYAAIWSAAAEKKKEEDKKTLSAAGAQAVPGKLLLIEVRDGVRKILESRDCVYIPRRWYKMEVILLDGKARMLFDGLRMLECASPALYGGKAGLYALGKSECEFDDFNVTSYQGIFGSENLVCRQGSFSGQKENIFGQEEWNSYQISALVRNFPASAGACHSSGAACGNNTCPSGCEQGAKKYPGSSCPNQGKQCGHERGNCKGEGSKADKVSFVLAWKDSFNWCRCVAEIVSNEPGAFEKITPSVAALKTGKEKETKEPEAVATADKAEKADAANEDSDTDIKAEAEDVSSEENAEKAKTAAVKEEPEQEEVPVQEEKINGKFKVRVAVVQCLDGKRKVLDEKFAPLPRSFGKGIPVRAELSQGLVTFSAFGKTVQGWLGNNASGRCGAKSFGTLCVDDVEVTPLAAHTAVATINEVFDEENLMAIWSGVAGDWYKSQNKTSAFDYIYWHRAYFRGPVEIETVLPEGPGGVSQWKVSEDKPKTLALSVAKPREATKKANGYTLTCRYVPDTKKISLELVRAGESLERIELPEGTEPSRLRLRLDHGYLVGYIDDIPLIVQHDPHPLAGERVAWAGKNLNLPAEEVAVYNDKLKSYSFNSAPVDWRVGSGIWEVANRWECDPRWSFWAGMPGYVAQRRISKLKGSYDNQQTGWKLKNLKYQYDLLPDKNDKHVVLWHKREFGGDFVVEAYIGQMMDATRGNYTNYVRDFNITVCGNGQDLESGYSCILGGWLNKKSAILKNGTIMTERSGNTLNVGNTHRRWIRVRVVREGNKLHFSAFTQSGRGQPERQLTDLWYEDPTPIESGHVAIWSYDCGILVARARISAEVEGENENPFQTETPKITSVYEPAPKEKDGKPKDEKASSGKKDTEKEKHVSAQPMQNPSKS